MGAFYETIPASLVPWILAQKLFWIASAPLSAAGHVNVSPKGGPYFGVVDERTFWYMDLTGSGIETTSHLHEPGNGRITVLFNALQGAPRILRLWGRGSVLEYGTEGFDSFVGCHAVGTIPGTRSIVVVDIHQVGTSCGFSVPFFDFTGFRPTLNDHWAKKSLSEKAGNEKDSMDNYWGSTNARSMDGLPGMKRGLEKAKRESIAPAKKMVGPFAPTKPRVVNHGLANANLALVAVFSFCLGIVVTLCFLSLAASSSSSSSSSSPTYRGKVSAVFASCYITLVRVLNYYLPLSWRAEAARIGTV